ncbi:uncharacterized protein LOC130662340 isoform X1 [Hydractinia symbiolongicarpus]|uniref:uncharacterized protein LOC130662340 isoform X1 n=1 Tax=Hydractinia symbiolongicarpus TaxID=13093 RepID=UPI00254CD5C3|nr:uncharacterized protein LOC130662340 isoform X1 [Hydractinia symbiolongicarpus]
MAPTTVSLCELWLKLCLYVENFIKQALLNVLHNVNNKNTYTGLPSDPSRLYSQLQNHHTKLTKLKDKKVINNDQWLLLFPANLQTDSTKFDPTLIVLLIINCTNLPPPSGGWKQKCPSTNDMSVGAFVLRAREFRNMIMHYSNPSILRESEFTTIWLEGDQILNGLGYAINTNTLKHDSLDPERMDYFRLFLNHLQYGQSQLQRLVDENTTDVSNLANFARKVIEIKESISDIKKDFEAQEANQELIVKKIDDAFAKISHLNDKYGKEIDEMKDGFASLKVHYEHHDIRICKLEKASGDETHFKTHQHFFNVHQNVCNFTGRESVLDEIYKQLNTPTNYSYSAVALTGLGGIGKTETAARYAQTYGKENYKNVFWLHAENLESQLIQLASVLNVNYRNNSIETLMFSISKSLENSKCLFVFDNVEDMESMEPVLRNIGRELNPHFIITSQFSKWPGLGIQQIEIDVFTVDEATRLCEFVDESEKEVLKELITELKCLPLAMQQAVSYIKKHSTTVTAYLDGFKRNKMQLLDINLKKIGEALYGKTLMTVWQMAFEKLKLNKHKVAIDVINMMSHMDGNFINTKAFLFHENIEDEIDLNEIVGMLCEYSLISKKNSDVTRAAVVTMHKLVQKVLKLYSENEQSNKKKEFVQERLCNILVKASQSSPSWDNDEENIWFLHVKKLWKEGLIFNNLTFMRNAFTIAFQRGEQNFHNDVLSKCILKDDVHVNDNASSLKSNIRRCNILVACGQNKAAIDSLKKILIDYKRELESKNFVVLYWKLNYAALHLHHGDREKGKKMYESVKNDIKTCQADYKMDDENYATLLKLEMLILYGLNEFEAAMKVIKKLERKADKSTFNGIQNSFDMLQCKAHILCNLKDTIQASNVVDELESLLRKKNIKQSHIKYIEYTLLKANIFWLNKNYEAALNVLTLESSKLSEMCNLSGQTIFTNIGLIHLVKGRYKIALENFNNAIDISKQFEINNSNHASYVNCLKGLTLLRLNKINEAVEELSKNYGDIQFSPELERIAQFASNCDKLRSFTKERKEKYGVYSMEFKKLLTDCQDKKRELNRYVDLIVNNFNFVVALSWYNCVID